MFPSLTKPTTTTSFFSTPPKPPSPLCTFLFLVILCILAFHTFHNPSSSSSVATHLRNSHRLHTLFLSSSSNSTISSYLRALTLHPHLAGTLPSLATTNYVLSHFQTLNLETHKITYKPLISYPIRADLAAHFPNGTVVNFSLTEKTVSANDNVVIPYHAYSPSGHAYAEVVFVNFGREKDYRALDALGVKVKGCVVLARKGGGLGRVGVVSIAEGKGAAAVLIYAEEDMLRGGGKGIERGTVMRGVGDPLSPGWAGVEGGERLGLEDSEVAKRFPKIPSLPLSFENADVILGSLSGPAAPAEWRKSGRSRVGRVGPGPTLVNFTYQGEKKVVPIHNVFATIRGLEQPDRYVILGNHRDAWTYGAVDPNSGTAVLLDIARRFALLKKNGWNPRRTIILSSWDAEEFGMVGSTEWVEQNLINLGAKAVAYLNVDCAVQGPGLFARATPQLDDLLLEVTRKVDDPDSEGATLYDQWAVRNRVISIQRLSTVDSDFAPFLQHAGVPSVDIYYGEDYPVYHTAFDSYEWMTHYADPLFHRHMAVAGIWGLLALRLADDSVIPFNYISYAEQLQGHKDVLSNSVDQRSLQPLVTSIEEFLSVAKAVEDEKKQLIEQESRGDFVDLKLRALNDRLMSSERGFLDADGLRGRQWFKHLIYGPSGDYESELGFFPGIANALSESVRTSPRDQRAAIQHEIWRVARAIERAASALRGELTYDKN